VDAMTRRAIRVDGRYAGRAGRIAPHVLAGAVHGNHVHGMRESTLVLQAYADGSVAPRGGNMPYTMIASNGSIVPSLNGVFQVPAFGGTFTVIDASGDTITGQESALIACAVITTTSADFTRTATAWMEWPQFPNNPQYAFCNCATGAVFYPSWGSTVSHGTYGDSSDALSKPSWMNGFYWSKNPGSTVYARVVPSEVTEVASYMVFSLLNSLEGSIDNSLIPVIAGATPGAAGVASANVRFRDINTVPQADCIAMRIDAAPGSVRIRWRA
jgi:hypothetical protein